MYPYNYFVITMYESMLMALVSLSTFLCTQKLGPKEVM